MNGQKVDLNYESPIDFIFIRLAQVTKPLFKNLCFTPNMITTLSLISSLMMYKEFSKQNFKRAGLWFLGSYYFDCLDGNFAISYNMVTKFGDYYDHLSDLLTVFLIFLGIYQSKIPFKIKRLYFYIITIFGILTASQLGCIQKMYQNKFESPTLNIFSKFCPKKDYINTVKYFGPGTLTILVFLIIYNYSNNYLRN